MADIQVKAPDGSIVAFPEGTSDDEMSRAMQEYVDGTTPPEVRLNPKVSLANNPGGAALAANKAKFEAASRGEQPFSPPPRHGELSPIGRIGDNVLSGLGDAARTFVSGANKIVGYDQPANKKPTQIFGYEMPNVVEGGTNVLNSLGTLIGTGAGAALDLAGMGAETMAGMPSSKLTSEKIGESVVKPAYQAIQDATGSQTPVKDVFDAAKTDMLYGEAAANVLGALTGGGPVVKGVSRQANAAFEVASKAAKDLRPHLARTKTGIVIKDEAGIEKASKILDTETKRAYEALDRRNGSFDDKGKQEIETVADNSLNRNKDYNAQNFPEVEVERKKLTVLLQSEDTLRLSSLRDHMENLGASARDAKGKAQAHMFAMRDDLYKLVERDFPEWKVAREKAFQANQFKEIYRATVAGDSDAGKAAIAKIANEEIERVKVDKRGPRYSKKEMALLKDAGEGNFVRNTLHDVGEILQRKAGWMTVGGLAGFASGFNPAAAAAGAGVAFTAGKVAGSLAKESEKKAINNLLAELANRNRPQFAPRKPFRK